MLTHHPEDFNLHILHWFCEKSYEERHVEHLDTLGERRWVHAVLSTQGFAKEYASEHAQGH